MRAPLLPVGAAARASGFVAVTAIGAAALLHTVRHEPAPASKDAPKVETGDSIAAELMRCRNIGLAAQDDRLCLASWATERLGCLAKLPCSRTSRARCNPTRSSLVHQAAHSLSRFTFRCKRTLCHCLLLPMQPRNADCRPATNTGCAELLISQRAMPGQHRVSANCVSKATAPLFPLRRHGMCATAVQASLSDAR